MTSYAIHKAIAKGNKQSHVPGYVKPNVPKHLTYIAGRHAYFNGKTFGDNPFMNTTGRYSRWACGFIDARNNDKDWG